MRFPPPADSKEIMISHGQVTHNWLDRVSCKDCMQAEEWFNKEVKQAGGMKQFIEKLQKENT